MKLKYTLLVLILLAIVSFNGCTGNLTSGSATATTASSLSSASDDTSSSATITGLDATSSSQLGNYTQSSFSNYIYFNSDSTKILIDLDFFPEGSDLCQQATYNATSNPNGCTLDKTIVIPCEFQSLADNDLLSINVSATSETTACENKVAVDLEAADFTVDGLVFAYSSSLDTFESDFEFNIKSSGFYDSNDNSKLSFTTTDVGLEAIYDKIVAKRTQ